MVNEGDSGAELEQSDGRYSFREFVLLRAVLAREKAPTGNIGAYSYGFASGWKLSALAHLRRSVVALRV